jgi:hypothetical protein
MIAQTFEEVFSPQWVNTHLSHPTHDLIILRQLIPWQPEDVSHVLAPSKGLSKLIPIDEEPNHQIVHLFRLGKANCTTH